MNETNLQGSTAASKMDHVAEQATAKADEALGSARRSAHATLDKLQSGVDELRQSTPGAVSRVAAQVEELARQSIERARHARTDIRDTMARTSDRTVGYIKDEPMKSVLVAAAAGATLAAVIALIARSRNGSR